MTMDSSQTEAPRRRLGRGLSALLGGSAPAHDEVHSQVGSELRHVAVAEIARNPFQPRKDFDPESLTELADSVREHGVLQPLLVREIDGGFQLIAGERRWQAAQKAGLATVPCRIVDVIDKTACEFALEENLKRKDLNDLEKAQAFRNYLSHFECTVEELARQLSMSRSAVSNILRLLDLIEPVKQALQSGRITAGHARALLALEEADQLALCGRIQAEGMSVRQTEAAVKELHRMRRPVEEASAPAEQFDPARAMENDVAAESPATAEGTANVETPGADDALAPEAVAPDEPAGGSTIPFPAEPETLRTPHVVSLEEQLRGVLGVAVEIRLKSRDAGTIVMPFATNDEFEHLLRQLRRAAA